MRLHFNELATFYERLEATPGRLDMIDIMIELFSKIDPSEVEIVCYLTLGKLGDGPTELTLGLADKLIIQTLTELSASFSISAFITGMAGALNGLIVNYVSAEVYADIWYSVDLLVAAVVGGSAMLFGPFIGGFFVDMVPF